MNIYCCIDININIILKLSGLCGISFERLSISPPYIIRQTTIGKQEISGPASIICNLCSWRDTTGLAAAVVPCCNSSDNHYLFHIFYFITFEINFIS